MWNSAEVFFLYTEVIFSPCFPFRLELNIFKIYSELIHVCSHLPTYAHHVRLSGCIPEVSSIVLLHGCSCLPLRIYRYQSWKAISARKVLDIFAVIPLKYLCIFFHTEIIGLLSMVWLLKGFHPIIYSSIRFSSTSNNCSIVLLLVACPK